MKYFKNPENGQVSIALAAPSLGTGDPVYKLGNTVIDSLTADALALTGAFVSMEFPAQIEFAEATEAEYIESLTKQLAEKGIKMKIER